MHYGPRPFRATKTCSRCGTAFPTRYEWKQHSRGVCDATIAAFAAARTKSLLGDLEQYLVLGSLFKEGNRAFRERLTIDDLIRAKERLGPPLPRFEFRPLVPPGTIYIMGDLGALGGLGIIKNVGKEPTRDGDAAADHPGKQAPAGADAPGATGTGSADPAAG